MTQLVFLKEVPSMNTRERMHWRAQRREVSEWEALARIVARAQRHPNATGKVAVHIHAFRRQRTRDEANLIGGCKGLIDGLVRAKLLVDDSREWATFTYAEDVVSKGPCPCPCTVVTITESTPPIPGTTKENV